VKRILIWTLILSAVLQFALTRRRAGQTIFEGDAEAMWLRYPVNVLFNAAIWSAIALTVRAGVRALRGLR
jgi:hypothetical protein